MTQPKIKIKGNKLAIKNCDHKICTKYESKAFQTVTLDDDENKVVDRKKLQQYHSHKLMRLMHLQPSKMLAATMGRGKGVRGTQPEREEFGEPDRPLPQAVVEEIDEKFIEW